MQLPELPEGFTWVRGQRGVLACRAGESDALAAAGFSPDGTRGGRGAERLPDAEESGREPLGFLEVAGQPCLARRFTHGGLARALTGARFRDPARPFDELILSERLRALGVATPRVVAARAVRVAPVGYELTLVTERLEGVRDMGWVLGEVRAGSRSRAQLRAGLVACARTIAALHRVGFLHADLQPANLLVSTSQPLADAVAIDLDRSRFVGEVGAPLPRDLAVKNLARLWRHVARREDEYGAVLTRTDRVRFLRAYGVDRADSTDRVELGSLALEIEEVARSRGALHRVGWWAESTFGRKEDRRANASARRR